MKIKEILAKANVGDIITNRQVLAALKKSKLIYDYSYHGYLEDTKIMYKDENYGDTFHVLRYLFPKRNAPEYYQTHAESLNDIYKKYGDERIEYMGYTFIYEYISGCFNPYLSLLSKKVE